MRIAIIGEIGSPFDMKPTALLGMAQGKRHGFKDYVEPSKVSSRLFVSKTGESLINRLWTLFSTLAVSHSPFGKEVYSL